MRNFQQGWYVLYVKSRSEKKVDERLKDIGQESFLPLIKKEKKWSDRTKIVETPLIPSYIFVRLSNMKDMHVALSVHGACFFLKFGSKFAIARDGEIQNLKLLLASEGVTELEVIEQTPIVGAVYNIDHGPLAGMTCEVLKVESRRSIKIRIESIRQDIIAKVPHTHLSRLEVTHEVS